jgi:hypothetical protein
MVNVQACMAFILSGVLVCSIAAVFIAWFLWRIKEEMASQNFAQKQEMIALVERNIEKGVPVIIGKRSRRAA